MSCFCKCYFFSPVLTVFIGLIFRCITHGWPFIQQHSFEQTARQAPELYCPLRIFIIMFYALPAVTCLTCVSFIMLLCMVGPNQPLGIIKFSSPVKLTVYTILFQMFGMPRSLCSSLPRFENYLVIQFVRCLMSAASSLSVLCSLWQFGFLFFFLQTLVRKSKVCKSHVGTPYILSFSLYTYLLCTFQLILPNIIQSPLALYS